jgi:hypothetical protein
MNDRDVDIVILDLFNQLTDEEKDEVLSLLMRH